MLRLFVLLPFLLSVFFTKPSSAQEGSPEGNIFDYTKKVHKSLQDLKGLGPKEYFKEIDNYRTELEKYFDQKKRVCEGEFSTVILTGAPQKGDEDTKKPVKLKPEERKLCFRELKALQLTFINNMYAARKRYLEYLHKERLQELDLSREKAVKSLQGSFNKRSRR
jgi:hypothetical protein